MKKVEIINPVLGILHMSVCVEEGTTDEEIFEVCNKENPIRPENGWTEVIREDHKEKKLRPVICKNYPSRKHFIVSC